MNNLIEIQPDGLKEMLIQHLRFLIYGKFSLRGVVAFGLAWWALPEFVGDLCVL